MKNQNGSPAKFTRSAKVATSALAVTSLIGLWNGIGHRELDAAQAEALPVALEPAAPVSLDLPALAPFPTLVPVPTLDLNLIAVRGPDSASTGGQVKFIVPALPAVAPLAALEPLPALPQMPVPPPPSSSSSGNSSSSNNNSSNNNSSKKSGSS